MDPDGPKVTAYCCFAIFFVSLYSKNQRDKNDRTATIDREKEGAAE